MWKRFALIVLVVVAFLALAGGPVAADHHESGETPAEMAAAPAAGSDPTTVDPDHYKVVFENDKIRVLRITYSPKEKSVMHYHPESVAVFSDDNAVRMTFPDGSSQVMEPKAGQVAWAPAGQHQPENLNDQAFEVIQVELKGAGSMATTAADVAALGKVLEMERSGVGSGDPEIGASAYADDIVVMAPGEPAINGKDAVRAWLAGMYEQFAGSPRIVIPHPGVVVVGDVGADEPQLVPLDANVCFVE